MATQNEINRINKRIRDLSTRDFQYKSEHFMSQFNKIIRGNNIGTVKVGGMGNVKGMISAKRFNALDKRTQKRVMSQLDVLMEETKVSNLKKSLSGMKVGMKKAFANRGVNMAEMTDKEYEDAWKKLQQMSYRYTGEFYSSEQDTDNDILESITDLYYGYQDDYIDKSELDDIFDEMMKESNAHDALTFLRDVELQMEWYDQDLIWWEK